MWTSSSWSTGRDLDPDIDEAIDFGLEVDLEEFIVGLGVEVLFGWPLFETAIKSHKQ